MLMKKYVKSRDVCKVTFAVPDAELPQDVQVKSLFLAGEFNDWDTAVTPLKHSRKGDYRVTIDLEPGRSYQFRYLLNNEHWCNDWQADGYTPNQFGEENCVVIASPN